MFMERQILCVLMLSFAAFTIGCDSSVDQSPYCRTGREVICKPAGFPFVDSVFPRSDACPAGGDCPSPLTETTTLLTQPQAGKVCMKGTVVGRDGFAWLVVRVSRWNEAETHIVDVLDAPVHGIDQLKFTIEAPPITGMTAFAAVAWRRDCDFPAACQNPFYLRSGPRSADLRVMDHSETVTAPFTDFTNDDPNVAFDTAQLAHFIFVVGAGDYDFCLADLTFLDAAGNAVPEPM